MRHFNMAAYILRSMSRFDGGAPLPLAGCIGVDGSGFFAAVLPRLEAFDRFWLFVDIYKVPENASLYRIEIFVDVQDATLNCYQLPERASKFIFGP